MKSQYTGISEFRCTYTFVLFKTLGQENTNFILCTCTYGCMKKLTRYTIPGCTIHIGTRRLRGLIKYKN